MVAKYTVERGTWRLGDLLKTNRKNSKNVQKLKVFEPITVWIRAAQLHNGSGDH